MRSFPLVAACAFVAASCAPSRERPRDPGDSAPDARTLHRGTAVVRDGASTFTPCGEATPLALDDRTPERLLGRLAAELSPDRGAVFVELRGELRDGTLTAVELSRVDPAGEGDRCRDALRPGETRALGNEPFWSVRASAAGITWAEPDLETPLAFPSAEPVTRGAERAWTSELPGRRIEILVRREPCRDGMSGAWHALSARVTLDGRAFEGCAHEG